MIAITTKSSMSVNPRRGLVFVHVIMAAMSLEYAKGLPRDGSKTILRRIRYRFGPSSSFDTSQTFTVWSRLPETRRRPSGLNATLLMRSV